MRSDLEPADRAGAARRDIELVQIPGLQASLLPEHPMLPTAYIADLRHNYSGVLSSDCMPLGIGYLKAVMDRDVPELSSSVFAYPDRLVGAMAERAPEVLMLSNYMWNEALSLHMARLVKQARPETLVIMGGPNIPIEADRQVEWVQRHPDVDVYVLGEGDFLTADVARHYVDAGLSLDSFRERELSSAISRDPDGGMRRDETRPRSRALDEIPSPFLTGIFDEFFDGKLAPMIETNRGCPFSCTFCVQGSGWYSKVNNFDIERLKEEIDYISRTIREHSPKMGTLRIADSNFGMFERDVEICEHIGRIQADTGWPTFIDATTGKNKPERIIRAIEKVNGALLVYQAVQSLDDNVLTRIKRKNIKLDTYRDVMIHVRGRGLRSNSDLILCLPGETLQTHLQAMRDLIDAGTDTMHNLQLVLVMGSELETLEARKDFAFESRFRVIPKMAGDYSGKVLDIEEIVVATDTMSFPDYLAAREYHLVISAFWNSDWFDAAIAFAESFGIRKSEWLDAVVERMRQGSESIRAFRDSFLDETRNELFPTREACEAHYTSNGNFERLLDGEIGDNLMYKYRAIASFHIWPNIVACAMEATRELLVQRKAIVPTPDFDEFWDDFRRHIELGHAHGRRQAEILADAEGTMHYDIVAWLAAGQPKDVAPFRHDAPVSYTFSFDVANRRRLEQAIDVWGPELKGLTKMVTRILPSWQTREARPVAR